MENVRIPAFFYRGGTSKAIIFKGSDLPKSKEVRDKLFLHVMGSPDPYQRQLNGLGGGISSLSKVAIVDKSERDDADVDYTFVQVVVDKPVADYAAMCGNISSAVGPFAVDEAMVSATDGMATVRIYNTNTDKIFHAVFLVKNGKAVERGDFEIPGVAGTGAEVALNFIDPGGAATGAFLPTQTPHEMLYAEGVGEIKASLVDASNPVVFVRAQDLDCSATDHPDTFDNDASLMRRLDSVRRAGGVAMGMATTPENVPLSNPKIAVVDGPAEFISLDGSIYGKETHDIAIRIVSMGKTHRAVTLTGAMCLAAAVRVPGTIPNQLAREGQPIRIGNPSGVLPIEAEVICSDQNQYRAVSTTSYRTQRRLMEGSVLAPTQFIEEKNDNETDSLSNHRFKRQLP
ncbi:MAG: PrpF domain-containing protein [Pseudomonadota bacterium]